MKKLLLIKPNILSQAKKKELKEADYIVIETDDLTHIIVMDGFGDLDRDTLLYTALKALDYGNDGTCRLAFSNLLRENLLKKRINP